MTTRQSNERGLCIKGMIFLIVLNILFRIIEFKIVFEMYPILMEGFNV